MARPDRAEHRWGLPEFVIGFGPSALSNRNATSGERKIDNTNQPKPSRSYRLLAFTPTMIERIIQKTKISSTTSTPWH
jgi:hypothetical protein